MSDTVEDADGVPGKGRRVLVVAYAFPPYGAIGTMRTLRLVRALHLRGWRVTVLTGHPDTYLPGSPVDAALLEQLPPSVRVVRARVLRPWRGLQSWLRAIVPLRGRDRGASPVHLGVPASAVQPVEPQGATSAGAGRRVLGTAARAKDAVDAALAIPDRESGWLLPAVIVGLMHHVRTGRPDVIYSSAPPWTGKLVALVLQAIMRRPWVADFRDPWARAPWREDRYWYQIAAARALERLVVRRADRILFVTSANRRSFLAHYGDFLAERSDVVENGCDPEEFDRLRGSAGAAAGPFVLLHAGSLYAGRTPMPVLRAVARAFEEGRINRSDFRLQFLGTNALSDTNLARACEALGIESVVDFLPRVPRAESLRAMMSASCLLLLQPGHTVSVPGKLYEYLAAARPILAVAEPGDVFDIVRASGLGVSLTPDDEDGILAALVDAVSRGWAQPASPPRTLFDGNIGANRIAEALEHLLAGPEEPYPATERR